MLSGSYSMGHGAAIKRGDRAASGGVIVFLISLMSEQITGVTYLSARSEREPA